MRARASGERRSAGDEIADGWYDAYEAFVRCRGRDQALLIQALEVAGLAVMTDCPSRRCSIQLVGSGGIGRDWLEGVAEVPVDRCNGRGADVPGEAAGCQG